MVGPFTVQWASDQVADGLHAFIGARVQGPIRRRAGVRRVHQVIDPCAVRSCGRPTVLPTFTEYRVLITIEIVRGAQVGASSSLLVKDGGLAIWTDNLKHQIAHEGVLHLHTDGLDIADIGDDLAKIELLEIQGGGER